MIPSKTQWRLWSLPSKYTAIGLLAGLIGLLVVVIQFIFDDSEKVLFSMIKDEVINSYKDIKAKELDKSAYIERYLKHPIAEIKKIEISVKGDKPIVYLYYNSYWESIALLRASIEFRKIVDLNKTYSEDEDWRKVTLRSNKEYENHIIDVGDTNAKYAIITNLSFGYVYEVRIVDYSYDSDEPPSLPFRFELFN